MSLAKIQSILGMSQSPGYGLVPISFLGGELDGHQSTMIFGYVFTNVPGLLLDEKGEPLDSSCVSFDRALLLHIPFPCGLAWLGMDQALQDLQTRFIIDIC